MTKLYVHVSTCMYMYNDNTSKGLNVIRKQKETAKRTDTYTKIKTLYIYIYMWYLQSIRIYNYK